ncbi:universal stress protein [Arthrobacter cupressi]|uniref:Nucleotide-binding universal stress protein, UspA family n=1 Tax=Arthrobacter cupressi TaxID=1045773 RepID=A0A1G8TM16_9MICC|nr:universal stress protein [Arthrobacter cupressi]NYD79700.1 nucleotide-binding universal stress UspA family protein [Arthrobacter cupressi]SDJ42581.1 Nucleotide-binding universal stress protein, UspA family [Arthrobacter cupressi]
MKNPIVVGVNDTEASQAAVSWAMRRAAVLQLPVILIHAVDDRWSYENYALIDAVRKYGTELLEKARARAVEAEPSVDLEAKLVSGSAGYVLRKQSRKASMVVVGAGESWFGAAVTDRALQIAAVAHCPVAVIGRKAGDDGRRGILVGADGSEEATQAVAFAAAEADRDGQDLTILHAFGNPLFRVPKGMPGSELAERAADEERVILSETAAGLAADYPDLVVHQVLAVDRNPAQALTEAAGNARLLVLGSRGKGAFKRLLMGSTAHAVLSQLPCPTIITRVRR